MTMRLLFGLALLIIPCAVASPNGRLRDFALTPKCVNGAATEAARDENGRIIRCHPGLSATVCPLNHSCLFNGIDFFCCPMEPPAKSQNEFLLRGMEEDRQRRLKSSLPKSFIPLDAKAEAAGEQAKVVKPVKSESGGGGGVVADPSRPKGQVRLSHILTEAEISQLSLDPKTTLEELLSPAEISELEDLLGWDGAAAKVAPTKTATVLEPAPFLPPAPPTAPLNVALITTTASPPFPVPINSFITQDELKLLSAESGEEPSLSAIAAIPLEATATLPPPPKLHEILSPYEIRQLQLRPTNNAFAEVGGSAEASVHRDLFPNVIHVEADRSQESPVPSQPTTTTGTPSLRQRIPSQPPLLSQPQATFIQESLPLVADFDGPLMTNPSKATEQFSERELEAETPSHVHASPVRNSPSLLEDTRRVAETLEEKTERRSESESVGPLAWPEAAIRALQRPLKSKGALETKAESATDIASLAAKGVAVKSPALRYALEQYRQQRPDGTMTFYARGGNSAQVLRGPPPLPTTPAPKLPSQLRSNVRYNYEYARWLNRYGTRHY